MKRIFANVEEFEQAQVLFEDRLEELDVNYKDYLLVNNVNGEAISSLNDIVRVGGMKQQSGEDIAGILFYFTELDVPSDIKKAVEEIFEQIFYDA